jgi:murein DD-endopeptidase MepM/ murein hydrolase activator NlpD
MSGERTMADQLEMTFRLRGTPEAIAAVQQIQRALERAGRQRDTTRQHRELDALKKEFRGITDAIGGLLRPALGGFSLSLSGITLGLGAAAVGLAKFSTSLVAMREGAQRVGMTFQQYRGTLEAAARVNIPKGEMAASLETIDKLIFDLRHRVPGAGAELQRMGAHDVVEAMRNAKDANEGLLIIMQKMLRLDPAGARLLAETAGVSPKITRMKIADLREAQREAKDLTAAELEKLRAEQREMAKLGVQYRNAQQSLAVAFAPALTPIVEAVTKLLGNKDVIGSLANSLNQLTGAIAALTPEQVEALSKGIGEFIKFVGNSVSELATALGALADFIDRVQGHTAHGEAPFGTYDIGKGRLLTPEEEEAARQKGGVPSLFPPTAVDTVGLAWGDLTYKDIGAWLRGPLIGAPAVEQQTRVTKETYESIKQLGDEYQKILDNMRGTPGGGTGTGAGGGAGGGGYAPGSSIADRRAPSGQTGGEMGAMGGVVHGHPVTAYGPYTGGQTLYEPMSGWLGGGVGGTSAKFGPGMHEGIDIMGAQFSRVYAIKDGEVVNAPHEGGGPDQVLTIRHADGTYTRYLHQNYSGKVKVGDKVTGGQEVGASGYRNAPHTHFEMWEGVPGRSRLMNPRAIYHWGPGHDPVGGRRVSVGEKMDMLAKARETAAAKAKNTVDIVIDATKAHELMRTNKGVPRIPSAVLGSSNAQQSPNMPQKGDAVGSAY